MRRLRIGTEYLRFVAGHQDRIDALAFAVLVKQDRINSLITNATYRKLKAIFSIGQAKLKKVLNDGVKFGFLRWEGKNLIANKLHEEGKLYYLLKSLWFAEAQNKGKLTLSGVRSMIEEAIIANHVSMQNDCADTHNRATFGKNLTIVRNAKKRESRMLTKDFCDNYKGLSYQRIQQLIARKKGKVTKIVKRAIAHGQITRRIRMIGANLAGDPCNAITKSVLEDTNIIVSPRLRHAYIRLSNEYTFRGRNIMYCR